MGRLGLPELIVIMVVLLLFFGGKKLPELGSSLGEAIRNFKKGFSGVEEEKPHAGNGPVVNAQAAAIGSGTNATAVDQTKAKQG